MAMGGEKETNSCLTKGKVGGVPYMQDGYIG